MNCELRWEPGGAEIQQAKLKMDFLTEREMAAAIWIVAIIGSASWKAQIRRGMAGVFRAAFMSKLSIIWIIGGVWVTLGVYLLKTAKLWDVGDLKDTIIWGVSAGVALLVHGFSGGARDPNYREILRDLFKLSILLELLLSTYCFALPIELILFPVSGVLVAMQAYCEVHKENKEAHKVINGLLLLMVAAMVWRGISGLRNEPDQLFVLSTLRSLSHPIFLTFWVLPLSYALGVMSAYETLFIPLVLGSNKSRKFYLMARWRLICHFGVRLSRVRNAPKQIRGRLHGVRRISEIDVALAEIYDGSVADGG